MSILTERLAEYVEIGGARYSIYTDFRNWIRIGSIMSDRALDTQDKILQSMKLCYPSNSSLPPTLESAMQAMVGFYSGTQKRQSQGPGAEKNKRPIYDFEFDAEYIFSAFLAQYGIDLTESTMHWHKFKALFMGLSGEHKICKIMEYRSIDIAEIKNKEQKAFYRKMKSIYRLPDMRTEEEKEKDMINVLSAAF